MITARELGQGPAQRQARRVALEKAIATLCNALPSADPAKAWMWAYTIARPRYANTLIAATLVGTVIGAALWFGVVAPIAPLFGWNPSVVLGLLFSIALGAKGIAVRGIYHVAPLLPWPNWVRDFVRLHPLMHSFEKAARAKFDHAA